MKYYAIVCDGGTAYIKAKDLNAAYKISDEGGLMLLDIMEIKFRKGTGDITEATLYGREKGKWYAVCPHTEETLEEATTLKALKDKLG